MDRNSQSFNSNGVVLNNDALATQQQHERNMFIAAAAGLVPASKKSPSLLVQQETENDQHLGHHNMLLTAGLLSIDKEIGDANIDKEITDFGFWPTSQHDASELDKNETERTPSLLARELATSNAAAVVQRSSSSHGLVSESERHNLNEYHNYHQQHRSAGSMENILEDEANLSLAATMYGSHTGAFHPTSAADEAILSQYAQAELLKKPTTSSSYHSKYYESSPQDHDGFYGKSSIQEKRESTAGGSTTVHHMHQYATGTSGYSSSGNFYGKNAGGKNGGQYPSSRVGSYGINSRNHPMTSTMGSSNGYGNRNMSGGSRSGSIAYYADKTSYGAYGSDDLTSNNYTANRHQQHQHNYPPYHRGNSHDWHSYSKHNSNTTQSTIPGIESGHSTHSVHSSSHYSGSTNSYHHQNSMYSNNSSTSIVPGQQNNRESMLSRGMRSDTSSSLVMLNNQIASGNNNPTMMSTMSNNVYPNSHTMMSYNRAGKITFPQLGHEANKTFSKTDSSSLIRDAIVKQQTESLVAQQQLTAQFSSGGSPALDFDDQSRALSALIGAENVGIGAGAGATNTIPPGLGEDGFLPAVLQGAAAAGTSTGAAGTSNTVSNYASAGTVSQNPTSASAICGFEDLNLLPAIVNAIRNQKNAKIESPSPYQHTVLDVMMSGQDLLSHEWTGLGKTTAAIVAALSKIEPESLTPQVLFLSASRTTAVQAREIAESILAADREMDPAGLNSKLQYIKCYHCVGGTAVSEDMREVKSGKQFILGTAGRVFDLSSRGHLDLSQVKLFVLDEALTNLGENFRNEAFQSIFSKVQENCQVCIFSNARDFAHFAGRDNFGQHGNTMRKRHDPASLFFPQSKRTKVSLDLEKEHIATLLNWTHAIALSPSSPLPDFSGINFYAVPVAAEEAKLKTLLGLFEPFKNDKVKLKDNASNASSPSTLDKKGSSASLAGLGNDGNNSVNGTAAKNSSANGSADGEKNTQRISDNGENNNSDGEKSISENGDNNQEILANIASPASDSNIQQLPMAPAAFAQQYAAEQMRSPNPRTMHTMKRKVVVYTNARKQAEWIADKLKERDLNVLINHAELKDSQRLDLLHRFKNDDTAVLVSCRLIQENVSDVEVLINYALPKNVEEYQMRAGVLGRFGRKGLLLNMILPSMGEERFVRELDARCQTWSTVLEPTFGTNPMHLKNNSHRNQRR